MSYMKGHYQVVHDGDTLNIQPSPADSTEKNKRTKRIIVITAGMAVAIALTLFAFFFMSYAHGIIFFLTFCLGGFYVLWDFTRCFSTKHACFFVDNEGIHEEWANSKHPAKKTIGWGELKFCKLSRKIVYDGDSAYDCIIFSKRNLEEKRLGARICKIWQKSKFDYEVKFKKDASAIYILIRSASGETVYREIIEYAHNHGGPFEKNCD